MPVRIPEGVREAIGRRLNRLTERCNETLTIASVVGREFELDQLARLIDDLSEDHLLEVLEEAVGAQIIEESPAMVGHYQFTHALIRETLVEELSVTRRVRLHAKIAEVLEELYGADTEAYSGKLAYHFGEAQTLLGTEKLVLYSTLAGQRALASYVYEEALDQFQRVLDAKESDQPDAEVAAALFGLGRAQAALGRIEEAIPNFAKALDYYSDTGDIVNAVAIGATQFPAWAGRLEGALELCTKALEMVDRDSLEAGRILPNHGFTLGFQEGDYEGAHAAFDGALAIARREKNVSLEAATLATAAIVDLYHLRPKEGLERSSSAIELARDLEPSVAAVNAHYTAAILLWFMGETRRIGQHAGVALAAAEQVRDRSWWARALFSDEWVPEASGDWDTGRAYSDRAQSVNPSDVRGLLTSIVLEYEVGDFHQGEVFLERLLDIMQSTPPGPTVEQAVPAYTISIAGRISGVTDRFDIAEEVAAEALSSPFLTPIVEYLANVGLALMAVERGDASAAGHPYAVLKRLRDGAPSFLISTDRVLGLLAHTMAELDGADRSL